MARTKSERKDTRTKKKRPRVLEKGEYQRADGRYEYRYKDIYGKTRSVYSWRLTNSDPLPKGKSECDPLRDMIRKIEHDKHKNLDTYIAENTTLNERFDIYIESKINIRRSTRENYTYMYNKYVRDTIGHMKIRDIKYSIIQRLYNDMVTKYGFKPNSMEVLHSVLNPIFSRAVWDNLIDSNPCPKAMKEMRSSDTWVREKKHALTIEQQKAFMGYVKSSREYKHWYHILTVLLGTGMRIGECLGLTWFDCLFRDGFIDVNHTLNYRKQEDGKCRHYIEFLPKTIAGARMIPMFDEVRQALLDEKERQDRVGTASTVIDGLSNWVFTNRYGTVYKENSINKAIKRIVKAYNGEEKIAAYNEGRKPLLLPHFTCHQLRHTFCTRLVEVEPRAKVVQEIMGHSDIGTTMEVYAEVEDSVKKRAAENVQGKLYINE